MTTLISIKQYNYNAKIHAKSGSTFIKRLLIHLHNDDFHKKGYINYYTRKPDIIMATDNKTINYWCRMDCKYNITEPKFTLNIVRNPYSRIVSSYIDKFSNNQNEKIQLESNTFENFILYIYNYYETNRNLDFNTHLSLQTIDYNINDNIIKLENIRNDLTQIYKKHNCQNTLNMLDDFYNKINDEYYINKTEYNNENNEYFGNKEINKDSIKPSYEYFYNEETMKIIQEIYHDDFIVFNYDKRLSIMCSNVNDL